MDFTIPIWFQMTDAAVVMAVKSEINGSRNWKTSGMLSTRNSVDIFSPEI